MMKTAGKKAREVDLSDFNIDKIEALDPSNTKGEHKVPGRSSPCPSWQN